MTIDVEAPESPVSDRIADLEAQLAESQAARLASAEGRLKVLELMLELLMGERKTKTSSRNALGGPGPLPVAMGGLVEDDE